MAKIIGLVFYSHAFFSIGTSLMDNPAFTNILVDFYLDPSSMV